MKACIIQPPYSNDVSFSDKYFQYKMEQLDLCDETMDIIVLPEYSDVPCATKTLEETLFYHEKYIDILLEKCIVTAKRCQANVFVNALSKEETGYRNTTYCYNKQGELAGKYFKKHLPPLELEVLKLDSDYTFESSEPFVCEIDGLRYSFLTCYDFYFYEAFANIARQNVDIIIGCSLQRSDSHEAIETMCRFLAYNTNAYVIRSSVSFAEDSTICGASMIVSPEGKVLANMKGRFGMESATFDPAHKYLKPAGFGNPDAPHYEYIEYGRKPWQYRPAGSAIVNNDSLMKYPRVCAHRGFNTIAPENSMPAFGAAVALGAEEIELDVWSSKDGVIMSCHDATLDRVSNGTGYIWEHTCEELRSYDFGCKHGAEFTGLKICTFEEILKKFACQTIMNVHIKSRDDVSPHSEKDLKELIRLIDKYDCRKYVYFMSSCPATLLQLKEMAPDIARCAGATMDPFEDLVDKALAADCKKIQLYQPHFAKNAPDYVEKAIAKAHANGIICNVFYADDPEEAKEYLRLGADVILTNDYQRVAMAVEEFKNSL